MKPVINFMGIRNLAFAFTMVLTVVALGSLVFKGLNFGLDFTGGTLIELNYAKPIQPAEVREKLRAAGYGDAQVQSFGTTTDILVRLAGDDPLLGNKISKALESQDGENQLTINRVEFVGPAVGEELRDQGGLGMLLAMAGVMLYVAFRFQWKFGAGAIVALFHDVIITLGVFSFFQIPFDLSVLAAVLAIIGYSLNDTIVVFDRIRENFRLLRKAELIENINISTTQTLLRTLATSVSTLLAVAALMFIGGENLWGFSLALFIGVTAGTYSSVYIASVMLVWLDLARDDLIPPVEAEAVDDRP